MVDGNFYCVLTVNTTSGMWMIYIGGPGVVLFGFYFYCYAGLLDRWYGMGEVGGGGEIFLILRNIFGLILNHVRYDDSRLELCKNITNSK